MRHPVKGAGQTAAMRAGSEESNVYRHWKRRAWYELPLLNYWRELSQPDQYVDIGAHVGNHAVWAAKAWPAARCTAIEASPAAFSVLADNLAHNGCGRVNALCAAAASKVGYAHLERFGPDEGQRRVGTKGTPVQTVRVDDVVEAHRSERVLIKVDTEDVNVPVIVGAVELLAMARCHLFIECSTDEAFSETDAALVQLGYRATGGVWGATPVYEWVMR